MIIIAKSLELNHSREVMKEQFSQLAEEKYAYVSQGERKIGRNKYTSLRNTYGVLSSGGIFPKYNYMFRIDTIKVISLMQHIQSNRQLKAGRLRNITIACHKFKNIPLYEHGVKFI